MTRGAAFFDLDRTLMAGSSGFHWARAAYRAGLLSRRQIAADAWSNVQFRLRGSTDDETEQIKARLRLWLEGRRVQDLERLSPGVLAGVLPRLYPQMLQLAYDHQDAGRPVYICTAASQGTADMLAHVLGFDGAAGTGLEERDGLDFAASYAYSDSASDIPMLRAVGHPVAVNPDAELLRTARAEGWDVLAFERLGRRLKVGMAIAVTVLAGTLAAPKIPAWPRPRSPRPAFRPRRPSGARRTR